jgi:transcription elongation factor SPT5
MSSDSDDYDYSEDYIQEKRKKKRTSKGTKKKKNFTRSKFIDDEAVTDNEDNSSLEDGFEREREEAENLATMYDRRRMQIDTRTPEEIAADLERRTQRQFGALPRELSDLGDQIRLPAVSDAKLWQVRCKKGKEREAAINLLHKALHKRLEGDPLQVLSVFASNHVKDFIYVEAYSMQHVVLGIRGMHMLYENQVKLVPNNEMVEVFAMEKAQKLHIKPGSFVRIRSGDYKGDLAQIVSLEEHRGRAMIRVVPRLEEGGVKKQQRKSGNKRIRPPCKLFNPQDFRDAEKKRDGAEQGQFFYCWNGMQFHSGFLHKFMSLRSLQASEINPTLAEIQVFQATNKENVQESIPFAQGRKIQFVQGDKVKVVKGDVRGLTGTVHTNSDGMISIVPHVDDMKGQRYEFPSSDLCKFFEVGDHIKVIDGRYAGITGMIAHTAENSADILCDVSKEVITCLCNDLKLTEEISSGQSLTSNYKVFDIVSLMNDNTFGLVTKVDSEYLTAVMNSGETKNVWLHEISKKYSSNQSASLDRDQNSLSRGDMVKICQSRSPLYNKIGSIKNSLRGVLFLSIPNEGEFGIVPMKSSFCLLLGTDSRPIDEDDKKRSELKNKQIILKSGPYKGFSGRVVDVNDNKAKVELCTSSKQIVVDVEACELLKSGENSISILKQDSIKTPAAHSPGYGLSTPAQEMFSPWETPRHDSYHQRSPSAHRSYRG